MQIYTLQLAYTNDKLTGLDDLGTNTRGSLQRQRHGEIKRCSLDLEARLTVT